MLNRCKVLEVSIGKVEELIGDLKQAGQNNGKPSEAHADESKELGGEEGGKTAAEQYREILAKLGGRPQVEKFADDSKKIRKHIQEQLKNKNPEEIPWRHDEIHHHGGFDHLLKVGQKVKPVFDSLIKKLAHGKAKAMIPGIKGKERGRVKIKVKYGGDSSQLSDVVRATLSFTMADNVLETMYSFIQDLLQNELLRGRRIYLTHFADRFQRPLGDYMDMLLLLKVNGFACELQLNIDELLEVKESGLGHGLYEKERKWNDELIHACMTGDPEDLQLAIAEGGNPSKPRDMYGLGPLHYAVQHGDLDMIEMLFF